MSLKRTKKEAKKKLVGEVSELMPGITKKFTLSNGKYSVEGILLNYQGISVRLREPVPPHWYLVGLGGQPVFYYRRPLSDVCQPWCDLRTGDGGVYLGAVRRCFAPECAPRDRS